MGIVANPNLYIIRTQLSDEIDQFLSLVARAKTVNTKAHSAARSGVVALTPAWPTVEATMNMLPTASEPNTKLSETLLASSIFTSWGERFLPVLRE